MWPKAVLDVHTRTVRLGRTCRDQTQLAAASPTSVVGEGSFFVESVRTRGCDDWRATSTDGLSHTRKSLQLSVSWRVDPHTTMRMPILSDGLIFFDHRFHAKPIWAEAPVSGL